MKFISKIIIAALVSVLLFSCSDSKETEKKEVSNPNGDSQLALAMRTIFNQTEEIKSNLNNGKLVIPKDYLKNLKGFHTATPTDPEVKVDEFFAFVNAIDASAKKLQNATSLDEQKTQYSRVINACIQCHKSFCPGPIRRIKKLKLPKMQ